MPISEVLNIDCMEYMKSLPDNFADLAIVDPPYGLGDKLLIGGKGGHLKFSSQYQKSAWIDIAPEPEYFDQLFRVSKNQIIWGGNYFNLPVYRCPIVWDKQQPVPNFSATELAWSSFDQPSKIFSFRQAGFCAEKKIHPTQKPKELYLWLIDKYAKPGEKILDTHLGSGSSRIAAYDLGFDFYATELDSDYYTAQEKRFQTHIKQQKLFTHEPYTPKQLTII